MHIPEIIEVKEHLASLKSSGAISDWELPYENILTRRSAAIFFLSADNTDKAAKELEKYPHFSIRENTEKKLSQLQYRVTFSEEEKLKNEKVTVNN